MTDRQNLTYVIPHYQSNLRKLEKAVSFNSYDRTAKVRYSNDQIVWVSAGSEACALCRAHPGCGGRIIFEYTSELYCRRTPWQRLWRALRDRDLETAIQFEKREIGFLRTLKK